MGYKIILVFVIVAILLVGCAGIGGQKDDKKDIPPAPSPTPQPAPQPSDDDYPPSLPDE
ncbi:hypothetical protein J4450_06005 [Candidatus Micrarchaeota archaeon]|nr:hypothetical protein [Candidatus Micrarchaeota archaeon]